MLHRHGVPSEQGHAVCDEQGEEGWDGALEHPGPQLLQRLKGDVGAPESPLSITSWVMASVARKKTTLPYILEATTIFGAPTAHANDHS